MWSELRTFIKAVIPVKTHVRQGHIIRGYTRHGEPGKKKKKISIKLHKWKDIHDTINNNMGWLIYVGKAIAEVHGIPIQFVEGQPMGDFADVIAEGRTGMLFGGQEWHGQKTHNVDMLTQMKRRAKQKMSRVAKKLMGLVEIPRDMRKQLAILSAAKEQYMKAHNGSPPTIEELAGMVTLHKRTKNGAVALNFDEKMARIEILETEKVKQKHESLVDQPNVYEADSSLWTLHTYDQRLQREKVHESLHDALKRKVITPLQRDILFMRFYIDNPKQSYQGNVRSFKTIANMISHKRGLEHIRMKYKVGDQIRAIPVREKKQRKGKNRGRVYEVAYKNPVTMTITKIKKDHYFGERQGRILKVKGGVPYKKPQLVSHGTIWREFEDAANKLIKDPKTYRQLKIALDMTLKAMRITMRKRMRIKSTIH